MQKKIIILVIIGIIILAGVVIYNVSIETEYIPQEEISNIDLRKTMVTLYYRNKNTKEIQAESMLIDSKELLKEPYLKLIEILLKGPNSDELEKIIPDNVKILETSFEKNTVKLKFSKEILVNNEIEGVVVDSISRTLMQLNEVESVVVEVEKDVDKANNIVNNDINNILQNEILAENTNS